MADVIDLGKLAQPNNHDEHLAGIVLMAQANPEAYRDVKDTEEIEEAFVLGYTSSLNAFVRLTTGGLVTPPEDVLIRCAYLAFVDLRGMMWVSALASTLPPPDGDELRFDPDLVVAYLTARKASEVAEATLSRVRDITAKVLQREAEAEAVKARLMMVPGSMRGAT